MYSVLMEPNTQAYKLIFFRENINHILGGTKRYIAALYFFHPILLKRKIIYPATVSVLSTVARTIIDFTLYRHIFRYICQHLFDAEGVNETFPYLVLATALWSSGGVLNSLADYHRSKATNLITSELEQKLCEFSLYTSSANFMERNRFNKLRLSLELGSSRFFRIHSNIIPVLTSIFFMFYSFSNNYQKVASTSLVILFCIFFTSYIHHKKKKYQKNYRETYENVKDVFSMQSRAHSTIQYYSSQELEKRQLAIRIREREKSFYEYERIIAVESQGINFLLAINLTFIAYITLPLKEIIFSDYHELMWELSFLFKFSHSLKNLFNQASVFTASLNDLEVSYSALNNGTNPQKQDIIIQHNHPFRIIAEDVSLQNPDGKQILKCINLQINAREIIGFSGESGAGKSTLGQLLFGLMEPSEGKIQFEIEDEVKRTNLFDRREHVVFVPQEIIIFPRSLIENIYYGRQLSDECQYKEYILTSPFIKLFKDIELHELINEDILSGGQKKAIGLMRAILRLLNMEYPICILDEAFTNLDEPTKKVFQAEFFRLAKEKKATIIIISHDNEDLMNCDRVYDIIDGELLETAGSAYKNLLS